MAEPGMVFCVRTEVRLPDGEGAFREDWLVEGLSDGGVAISTSAPGSHATVTLDRANAAALARALVGA